MYSCKKNKLKYFLSKKYAARPMHISNKCTTDHVSHLKPVEGVIRTPLGSLINIVTSRAINKDRET